MSETQNLDLPLLTPSQAQKHVTVNEALGRLDGLVQAVAQGTQAAPPDTPLEGQMWIVAPGAAQAWAGWDGDLALWQSGGWVRLGAREGWRVWSRETGIVMVRLAAGWASLGSTLNVLEASMLQTGQVPALGINAAADATNGFVFAGTNALLTSEAGIDATFNKGADWADATVSFKTNYAPRALMGLLGNDDFSLKMGSRFIEALRVNHHSGRTVVRALQVGARPWNAVARNRLRAGSWEAVDLPVQAWWSALDWASDLGLFCAVARSGTDGAQIMTSVDGKVWVPRTAPGSQSWSALLRAPELGVFVALAEAGAGDRLMISADAVTWQPGSVPARTWSALSFAPEIGRLVAVARGGTGNRAMYSDDGLAWTLASTNALAWRAVVWASDLGLFVAVAATGDDARVMTSPDGSVWTLRGGTDVADWSSLAWSPELGRLVAVAEIGTAGQQVMVSSDGVSWSVGYCPEARWQTVRWAAEVGLFVAVAQSGAATVMVSTDGYDWQALAGAPTMAGMTLAWAAELGRLAVLADAGTPQLALSAPVSGAEPGARGPAGTVVYDAGTPDTDFAVGVSLNCGGVA